MTRTSKGTTNRVNSDSVAWSPAPPTNQKKKKPKTESLIQRLKRQKEEKQRLIDSM